MEATSKDTKEQKILTAAMTAPREAAARNEDSRSFSAMRPFVNDNEEFWNHVNVVVETYSDPWFVYKSWFLMRN
jgi:hypothetical protein